MVEILLMDNIHVDYYGERKSLWDWTYWNMFASWLPPVLASLVVSLLYVGLFMSVAWIMYKRKIFITL